MEIRRTTATRFDCRCRFLIAIAVAFSSLSRRVLVANTLRSSQDYLDSPPALSIPPAFEAHTAKVGNAILPSLTTTPVTPSETLFKASLYYNAFQSASGCWHGDYSGPIFLNPGLVILWYVTRLSSDVGFFPDAEREAMKAFFLAHVQDDGGWGTHVEGPSTMFGTGERVHDEYHGVCEKLVPTPF